MCQKVDELDKNHFVDDSPYDSSCDGCIYEKRESALCPVKTFELYLLKLNSEIECLWQRPKETVSNDDPVWYCMAPLGKNTLGTFMKAISKNANLSQEYTNGTFQKKFNPPYGRADSDRLRIQRKQIPTCLNFKLMILIRLILLNYS